MEFGHDLSAASLLKLISFIFWASIYLWFSVEAPDQSPEWCSRAVTLIHGSVASIVGLSQCGVQTISKCRLTMRVLAHQYALMVWSWGYFAFDLLWCLVYWTESPLMLCHHISALVAITLYMQKSYTGCAFACTLALLEITNPLLQTRWFLKNAGYEKTIFYKIVEATYLLMFLSVRGVLGTYVVFKILVSDIFDIPEKLIGVVLYIVSLGFIYEIYGFVSHKYKHEIEEFKGYINGLISNQNRV